MLVLDFLDLFLVEAGETTDSLVLGVKLRWSKMAVNLPEHANLRCDVVPGSWSLELVEFFLECCSHVNDST